MPQSTPKAHRAEQDGYFAHATLGPKGQHTLQLDSDEMGIFMWGDSGMLSRLT